MNDTALAVTWIGIVAVVGLVIATIVLARSRVAQARLGAGHLRRYEELAERCAAEQQRAAAELARLAERLGAVEKLLRDVG
jgi:uncharacterized protein YbjQ (UPF0145 family)